MNSVRILPQVDDCELAVIDLRYMQRWFTELIVANV